MCAQEMNDSGEEDDEDAVQVLGGDDFTPEEIAAAEARFEALYGHKMLPAEGGAAAGAEGAGAGAGAAAGAGGTGSAADGQVPVHVLPLYAMLPHSQQQRVFQPPPPGEARMHMSSAQGGFRRPWS